jgi:hypothetical protein
MKNDRIGISKESHKKKPDPKNLLKSTALQMAEKEYEEYYNRIKLLSRGL